MKIPKQSKKELIFEFILFPIGIITITLFYNYNYLLTFLLAILSIIQLRLWPKRHDLLFFIFAGIACIIAETIWVNAGSWSYASPFFLGLPLWLPLSWALIAVIIKRTADTMRNVK